MKQDRSHKSVGSLVLELMSRDEVPLTAGEVLDAYSQRFISVLQNTVETEAHKFRYPFYVLVLSAKEMWAPNLVRNWFVARQTAPVGLDMVQLYPNHTKTLYEVHREGLELRWTLPGLKECESIMQASYLYHPDLVKWIEECFQGTLEPISG